MKKMLRVFMVFALVFQIITPAFAAERILPEDTPLQFVETVNIDGINYTYTGSYSAEQRLITISNDKNDKVDVIIYNPNNSLMHFNGKVISVDHISTKTSPWTYILSADDNWKLLSSDSYTISWATGTTVAVVAGALAAYLGTLGPAGVIAAIGSAALSTIASNSIGGTLDLEVSIMSIPGTPPTYRYKWSFTPSTGETYGPYYYHFA